MLVGGTVKTQYNCDGTHMNRCILPLLQRELDFDENSLEASEFLALAHRMGHVQMTKAQARSFSPLLLAVPLLVVEVVKCV